MSRDSFQVQLVTVSLLQYKDERFSRSTKKASMLSFYCLAKFVNYIILEFYQGRCPETIEAELTRLLVDGQEPWGAVSGHKSELSLNRVERSFSTSVKFSLNLYRIINTDDSQC